MTLHKPSALLLGLFLALAACQSPENTETEQTARQQPATADTTQVPSRGKPDYYSFKGLERKRVYICMDPTDDTFHQKHDCAVLVACNSTFRNLTLARAIENFDRYNCETCSADLAYIFDESEATFETGIGL